LAAVDARLRIGIEDLHEPHTPGHRIAWDVEEVGATYEKRVLGGDEILRKHLSNQRDEPTPHLFVDEQKQAGVRETRVAVQQVRSGADAGQGFIRRPRCHGPPLNARGDDPWESALVAAAVVLPVSVPAQRASSSYRPQPSSRRADSQRR
jgi:hypothetical protein